MQPVQRGWTRVERCEAERERDCSNDYQGVISAGRLQSLEAERDKVCQSQVWEALLALSRCRTR